MLNRSIKPKKSRGQNFLIDKNIINKIIEAADIKKDQTVLEVGPGQGSITFLLAQKAKQVIAVEIDQELFDELQKKRSDFSNLLVLKDDILAVDLSKIGLIDKKYKVVANIPYNITSAIIKMFLENKIKPCELILMVQKEVAMRIMEKPGQMSVLALSVQYYCQPQYLFTVSKNCFWPKPKVDSAVIRLVVNQKIPEKQDQQIFFRIIKAGFAAKRKYLLNNLAKGLNIKSQELKQIFKTILLDEKIRAQELSMEQWSILQANLAKFF